MTQPALAMLAPGGALSRSIPGYEDRPQQRQLARAVAEAIEDRRVLLAEAGTGTGKTLAYLVPAVLSRRRVVVSTGTRTLQEQIARADLPLLRALIDVPFTAVTLKGIANYVCRRKLAAHSSLSFLFEADRHTADGIADWARSSVTGDRAEVDWLTDRDPVWERITTTPEARLGPRCPHFEDCFVTRARRAADAADLILVNHHLLLADLALRTSFPGARVLPRYDALIIDEAHQLEEVATEHFAVGASTTGIGLFVRDARSEAASRRDDVLDRMAGHVERVAAGLFAALRKEIETRPAARTDDGDADPIPGAASPRVPLPPDLFAGDRLREAWLDLDTALDELAAHATLAASGDDDADAESLWGLCRRAGATRDALAHVAEGATDAYVTWAEAAADRVSVRASPIDVGPILRRELFEPVGAVVLTSATLTAEGSFRYTRDRLSLDPGIADELAVPAPFDYARQALLYLPRDLPDPRDARFSDACAARVRELLDITRGRAFVLFTSHRALRDAAARLADLPYPVWVQGQAPRAALIDRFRTTDGSVLLATGGFWEGVDVPGDALSQVIIDKLPFAPPTDPLVRARLDRAAADGRDPFLDHQVPQAAISLRQGFGRLIRRQDDRGIVSVLDRRVLTKTYGRAFVASLPAELPRTASIERVRRWWSS